MPAARSLLLIAALVIAQPALAEQLRIDCAATLPPLRPLHGASGAPRCLGETLDLTEAWRAARIPISRLHDCEWPGGSVVDMHTLFPDATADPASPKSYRFARTDAYIQSILDSGAQIVFRLGESIEHTKVKHFVHPPADNDRWAAAALGVIRHYNEGWADGFHHKIRYWEIWNEPENRPSCWTGSDEQYLRLYSTAALAIRRVFPELKVGGPASGNPGEVIEGRFRPTPFMAAFLRHCKASGAPLDFFSFHLYGNDPREYRSRPQAIRRWLNDEGFAKTELHLNEWNYLPDNSWSGLSAKNQGGPREAWYARQQGIEAAAFAAAVLVELQDAEVDVANFFKGDAGDFGLFNSHGVPLKPYHAFAAFDALAQEPRRLATRGAAGDGWTSCAAASQDRRQVTLLVSHLRGDDARLRISLHEPAWSGRTSCELQRLDAELDLEPIGISELAESTDELICHLRAPAVLLVKLHPSADR